MGHPGTGRRCVHHSLLVSDVNDPAPPWIETQVQASVGKFSAWLRSRGLYEDALQEVRLAAWQTWRKDPSHQSVARRIRWSAIDFYRDHTHRRRGTKFAAPRIENIDRVSVRDTAEHVGCRLEREELVDRMLERVEVSKRPAVDVLMEGGSLAAAATATGMSSGSSIRRNLLQSFHRDAPQQGPHPREEDVRPMAEYERAIIEFAICATGGDAASAAELLGISRAKIFRRLRDYGLSLAQVLERYQDPPLASILDR